MPDVKKHNWMYYGNTQGIVCSLSQRVFIQSLPHLVKMCVAGTNLSARFDNHRLNTHRHFLIMTFEHTTFTKLTMFAL